MPVHVYADSNTNGSLDVGTDALMAECCAKHGAAGALRRARTWGARRRGAAPRRLREASARFAPAASATGRAFDRAYL